VSEGNDPKVATLTLTPKDFMAWRVATRPGKGALEVIDPEDWDLWTAEKQGTYQSMSLFPTEQEADKFAKAQVDAAKPGRPKLPPRLGS
jgi:hypothetical protein